MSRSSIRCCKCASTIFVSQAVSPLVLWKMFDLSSSKWTVAPFSNFYGKIWVGFCLNTKKALIVEVSFKRQEKEHRLFLKRYNSFSKNSFFWKFVMFYATAIESFASFRYFNSETNFVKNEILFQKTGVEFFSWKY